MCPSVLVMKGSADVKVLGHFKGSSFKHNHFRFHHKQLFPRLDPGNLTFYTTEWTQQITNLAGGAQTLWEGQMSRFIVSQLACGTVPQLVWFKCSIN